MDNCHRYFHVFPSYDDVVIEPDAIYFFGISPEERSKEAKRISEMKIESVDFVQIDADDTAEDTISWTVRGKRMAGTYNLRNLREIREFIQYNERRNIYIDATGLDNRICAPIIKQALKICEEGLIESVRIIYSEPSEYDVKKFRSEGVFSDLSEKIRGIYPLPGFIKIYSDSTRNLLIPLLGFEGGRFMHLIENVEFAEGDIVPVIGLPGFRMEYPHVAFWGNRKPLLETGSWANVKYASANSVVELYFLLLEVMKSYEGFSFKIAPIGTKPHAIGAMLVASKHEDAVELIYDNPVRKIQKTKGVGNVIECYASKLIEEN